MADPPTSGDSDAERDLVVIGASAGGVQTLKRVVAGLPGGLRAAVCIVLHIAPDSHSVLARILDRAGPLPCRPAEEGEPLRPGEILVAPPDRHLTVEDGEVHLTLGPRENGHRPAVDVLFRSAAHARGARVIGVILSGTQEDGAAGLAAVKSSGGATIVQDPSEALYAGMPAAALAHVVVDAVVPSGLVADTIASMVRGEEPPPGARRSEPELDPSADARGITVCPQCGGVLNERSDAGMAVWECGVGHRYSPESLADAQAEGVEAALWAAIRGLEDRGRVLEQVAGNGGRGVTIEPSETATLDVLLEFVKETRGFDFTGYKRASIERRVAKRMSEVGVERYDDYIDYLELHSEEFAELFNTILINVTGFFRDAQAWEYLAESIVPQLIESRAEDAPLRIWCAGCASGEEPYTVAMVLARVLGDEAFEERVKIYATDVDEGALDEARHGGYLPRQIEDVPRDALERFFERSDQRYVFRNDLRRSVIFGRNDLVQDAPISRIDLLVCRNTLMYFTAETQAQVLRRFHFALDNRGFLMLGKSEMLITHAELFTPIELKWRVFHKVIRPAPRGRLHALPVDPGNGASQSIAATLRETVFDTGRTAQVVLDANGSMVMANEAARRMFALGVNDFGRPVQDLELSYRPIELRSRLEALSEERRTIDVSGVRWRSGERTRMIDVRITPLLTDGVLMGASVVYLDVTDEHHLQEQLSTSKQALEEAYEELQSTVEELETTNEELQSTNEELETTNEELQSTNEELETMNEELQSTNEELETINDELRHRTLELNDTNTFLETILTTIGLAVIVIDRGQHVRIWNRQAREMWGLTPEEAEGQHLFSLDIGLPVEKLRPQLKALLSGQSGHEELVVEATNRRGRNLQCRVTFLPLGPASDDGPAGVIMMIEAADD